MMQAVFLQALASQGALLITHLGLVDDHGVELAAAPYQRRAVAWSVGADGTMRLRGDLTFDVAAGGVVAGWRGYSASAGGTDYGGEDLPAERFTGQGQYVLLASGTGIALKAAQ